MSDGNGKVKIEFLATFPDVLAAIKVTGGGNGMRIQLDIPEDEMGNAAYLILMRQCVLKVTMEVKEESANATTINRSAAKQRKR